MGLVHRANQPNKMSLDWIFYFAFTLILIFIWLQSDGGCKEMKLNKRLNVNHEWSKFCWSIASVAANTKNLEWQRVERLLPLTHGFLKWNVSRNVNRMQILLRKYIVDRKSDWINIKIRRRRENNRQKSCHAVKSDDEFTVRCFAIRSCELLINLVQKC